jgi:hypothetical protein
LVYESGEAAPHQGADRANAEEKGRGTEALLRQTHQVLEGEMFQGQGAVILPLVAVVMTVVGLLAALGPAQRGLRIQPKEALREE